MSFYLCCCRYVPTKVTYTRTALVPYAMRHVQASEATQIFSLEIFVKFGWNTFPNLSRTFGRYLLYILNDDVCASLTRFVKLFQNRSKSSVSDPDLGKKYIFSKAIQIQIRIRIQAASGEYYLRGLFPALDQN